MTPAKAIAGPGTPKWIQALPLDTLGEMAVPLAVLAIVIALITPLPSFVLDLLIATDILMSVTVLMVSLYLTRPVEFTSFPTTLLLLTLFRLALNISSSRLILLNGNTGTSAAGEVIGAFGSFVVGGNYIIGAVIFLVLIAIQYVVINHGAVRISEVTARFTLDALPGKQMSIDSDLNAGLIDEAEAKRRRKQLATEAEFYGAMDGASRFTQRDAVASILITAINIVAGFLIGVLQHGMDFMKALQTYTVLTIGDGLVTVIPGADDLDLGRPDCDARQLRRPAGNGISQPDLRKLAAAAAGGRCVVRAGGRCPACPSCRFCCWAAARARPAGESAAAKSRPRRRPVADAKPAAAKENLESLMRVEPLAIEVGLGLVGLVEGGAGVAPAAPHFRDPPAAGHRPRLSAAAGARHRQPLPAQPGICDLAQRAWRYPALRAAAGLRAGDPPGRRGAAGRRPADTRAGLRHERVLDSRRNASERARQAGYTVVDPVSACWARISPN